MEKTQATRTKPPLPTEQMSELSFRRLAGLCQYCGVARETDPEKHTCDICENAQMQKENRYLNRRYRAA